MAKPCGVASDVAGNAESRVSKKREENRVSASMICLCRTATLFLPPQGGMARDKVSAAEDGAG